MTRDETFPVAELDGAKLYVHPGGKTGGIIKGAWDIGLAFQGKLITDYDNCYELPAFAVALLRQAGYRFPKDMLPPKSTP